MLKSNFKTYSLKFLIERNVQPGYHIVKKVKLPSDTFFHCFYPDQYPLAIHEVFVCEAVETSTKTNLLIKGLAFDEFEKYYSNGEFKFNNVKLFKGKL